MTFALVQDGEVQAVGRLPGSARRIDNDKWLMPPGGLSEATKAQQEACGWFAVVDSPPSFNEATEVLETGEVTLVDGVPTRQYTKRAKTQAELDADADNADRDAKRVTTAQAIPWLRQQAATARGVNVTGANSVNVLGALVTNIGKFYDHFADYLEAQRVDEQSPL